MPETHDLGRLFVHAVQLDPGAPLLHRAETAEYDDPCRYSRSIVIKTPFRRWGRWHGIRKSWISIQIKLPTSPTPKIQGVWGIVVGWWRYPEVDKEWEALARATRVGYDLDGDDERDYEAPTSDGNRSALSDITGRRTDDPDDAGADAGC